MPSLAVFLAGPPASLKHPDLGDAAPPGATLVDNGSLVEAYATQLAAAGLEPGQLAEESLLAAGVAKVFHRKRLLRWQAQLFSGREDGGGGGGGGGSIGGSGLASAATAAGAHHDAAGGDAVAASPPPDDEGGFKLVGVKVAAFELLLARHPEIEAQKLSTSTVCHTIIKPLTTPEGWRDDVAVVDADKHWYSHSYSSAGMTGQRAAPPGTCSFADLLLREGGETRRWRWSHSAVPFPAPISLFSI